MNEKLLSYLGIARKAGKLVYGFDQVKKSAQEKRLSVIILADDLSPKTGDKIIRTAENLGIEYFKTPAKMDELGFRLGTKAVGILGVEDAELAKLVSSASRLLNEEELI